MADKFLLQISAPDGKHFEDLVELINVRLSDGEIGIMKGHLPLVGIVEISHLHYIKNGRTTYFAIGGGILEVQSDRVLILADSFETRDEIDRARAEEARKRAAELLKEAQGKTEVGIDVSRAETALKRAINRLSLTD